MISAQAFRRSWRFALDFVICFIVVSIVGFSLGHITGDAAIGAHAFGGADMPSRQFVPIGEIGGWRTEVLSLASGSGSVPGILEIGGGSIAMLLLAASTSFVLAFNLLILRHLRRVNASPRRRSWGRD